MAPGTFLPPLCFSSLHSYLWPFLLTCPLPPSLPGPHPQPVSPSLTLTRPTLLFRASPPLYPSSHLPFGQPLQQNGPYLFCDSLTQSHLPDVLPWPWPPSSSSTSSSGRSRGWRTRAADPGVAAPGGDLSPLGTSSIPEALAFARVNPLLRLLGRTGLGEWDQFPSPCLQNQLMNSRGPSPIFCPFPLHPVRLGRPAPSHAF